MFMGKYAEARVLAVFSPSTYGFWESRLDYWVWQQTFLLAESPHMPLMKVHNIKKRTENSKDLWCWIRIEIGFEIKKGKMCTCAHGTKSYWSLLKLLKCTFLSSHIEQHSFTCGRHLETFQWLPETVGGSKSYVHYVISYTFTVIDYNL